MAEETVSVVIRAKDLASAVVKTINRQFKQFGTDIKAAARDLAVLGAAAAGAAFGFAKLVQHGGRVESVSRGFTKAVGDQETALRKLRGATQGLLTDQQLMLQFNRALVLGAAENVDQFGRLAQKAIALGRAQGLDATQSVNDLTLGLARQSRQILDNLGISVRAEDAYRRYAEANRILGRELTDAEKKQAFFTEAMRQADVAVSKLGGTTLNAADKVTQITVRFRNFVDQSAQKLATDDRIAAFFDTLLVAMDRLLTKLADLAPKFAGFLQQAQLAFGLVGPTEAAEVAVARRIPESQLPIHQRQLQGAISGLVSRRDQLVAEQDELRLARGRERNEQAQLGIDMVIAGVQKTIDELDETLVGFDAALEVVNARLRNVAGPSGSPAAAPGVLGAGVPGVQAPFPFELVAGHLAQQSRDVRRFRAGLSAAEMGGVPDLEGVLAQAEQMAAQVDQEFGQVSESSIDMASIVASNISSAVGAIATGSGSIESNLIRMITNIAAAQAGGPLGFIIGGVGGLLSGLFGGGRRDPVPVHVASAAPQLEEKIVRSQHVTVVLDQFGVPVSRVQYEIRRRERMDAVERIPVGVGLG